MISERVEQFIQKFELKEPFLVAFSGGYDSMCLLDVLTKLKYKIIAIHLNHNWRANESKNDEENCKVFCKNNSIQFYSETLPDDIPHTETAAREARYNFFYKCAMRFKSNVVFTAHNYDDNAETVIYRVIKGTGPLGLVGIQEKRDIFYRPLLSVSRENIEKYCSDNNLNPNIDSSNNDTKYKRNLIRKKIIPLMKEINPNVIDAINSLSQISKEDLCVNNSIKYEIRQLLIENKIDYDRKKIEEICKFIEENKNSKSGKTLSLKNNLWLFVNNQGYKTVSKYERKDTVIKIKSIGEYNFDNFIFSIKPCDNEITEFPSDKQFKAYINVSNIDFTLRYRKNGDVIRPLGCSGKQKLKKYLNEKKIPNHEKDKLVLLCDSNEILWVAGYGISDKIKVENKPTHIIELRVKDE